jgi:uncharacterized RDD family membrane protein YckC
MATDANETAQQAFGEATPPRVHEPQTHRFADWWTRAGAFLLDQLFVSAIVLVAVLLAVAFGATDSHSIETAVYAATIPVGCLYAPLLMARRGARNGQTLGKQIVDIRVVPTNGGPMTFWNGVLRTVVAQQLLIAVTFYVWAFVDYLWPLRDPRNQALHDKIAKTFVLRTDGLWDMPSAPDEPPAHEWLPPRAPGA